MAGNSGNPIDLDLTPPNVVQGVDIFGVLGTAQTGQVPGSGLPSLYFGFPESEAMTLNQNVRIECGTYETASHIYFVYGMGTGRASAASSATALLTLCKWNKTTEVVDAIYKSEPVRTSVRSSGGLSVRLLETGGVIGFDVFYGVATTTQHIEFDTGTDTFGAFGANVFTDVSHYGAAGSTLDTSVGTTMNNFNNLAGGVPQGTAGASTGSVLGNSVPFGGFTYSTAVLNHTTDGVGNGAELTAMFVYGVARRV